jgi:superfamily II DNA/RNA helicase
MVFSATFSKEMKAIALRSLRSDYHIVDLVGDEDLQTHSHVPQTLYTVDMCKYDDLFISYLMDNMIIWTYVM